VASAAASVGVSKKRRAKKKASGVKRQLAKASDLSKPKRNQRHQLNQSGGRGNQRNISVSQPGESSSGDMAKIKRM